MSTDSDSAASSERPNLLARAWPWLRWIIAVSVVALLFFQYRSDVASLLERRIDFAAAGVGLLLVVTSFLLTFWRWHLLMLCQGLSRRLQDAIRLGFLGYLFNYVAPGGAGGDVVKAVLLTREEPERKTLALTTIVMDRLLGMIALFHVGTAAIFLLDTPLVQQPLFQPVKWSFLIGSLGGCAGLALMLVPALTRWRLLRKTEQIPKIGGLISRIFEALDRYQVHRTTLLAGFGLSLVGHLLMLSGFYWCGKAVVPGDQLPDWFSHLQFIPAAELAGVLVPLPGGVGGLEKATAELFSICGFSEGGGFLEILVYRIVAVCLALIGAGYYFASRAEIDGAIDAEITQEPEAD